jgi:hypothetical protein
LALVADFRNIRLQELILPARKALASTGAQLLRGRNDVCDLEFEEAFIKHMDWNPQKGAPYVIDADKDTLERVAGNDMVRGVTMPAADFSDRRTRTAHSTGRPQPERKGGGFQIQRISHHEL